LYATLRPVNQMNECAMTNLPAEPHELTAAEAARLIAARALSAEDLARACLARIAERDPAVKAWVAVDAERAIAKARECDKLQAAHGPLGPLHGLPVGIKDMIDTADLPTTNNSPLYQGHRPAQDAQAVRLLTAAGAYVLGKTDTVEFAGAGRKAATRHPLDPARTPGGSSSGSGAAVGDRQVPLALGTQTAGSHIRPASFNGIYALKPTHGTVPLPGARQFAQTLDTIGWYGRSPEDLILVAQAYRVAGIGALPSLRIEGLKIGVARTHNWDRAAPETQAAVERAATLLAEAGARVTDLALPAGFETLNDDQRMVMRWEAQAHFLPDVLEHGARAHPGLHGWALNSDGATPERYLAAIDHAAACRAALDALFGAELDAILTPSAVGEAPVGPEETTGDPVMNSMWTLLHAPCINIPGATGPNGLPVGVTLAGPRLGDARLLAVAKAVAPVLDPMLRA
jgi:Asp-tRNA(Asn)/Glu-tRNA(Gln) amidotransferase A subunit family amidase